jgi:hypothetical protein
VSGVDSDRQRWTSSEPDSPSQRGLTVFLWLLVALVAEVEFLLWLFARTYGP